MKIEIKNRWDNKVLVSGKYENIKECLEKNRDANLRYSDLRYSNLCDSNLRGSDLRYSNLRYSDLSGSNLCDSNLRGSDLRYSNLRYSDLSGSNLCDSNLRGSDLRYSNLRYSDLSGIKNYSEHHTIFQEVVRQQKIDTFTQKEWSIIGQIIVHRLCWDSIKKRFNKSAMGIFKKLKKVGFDEWEEKYK